MTPLRIGLWGAHGYLGTQIDQHLRGLRHVVVPLERDRATADVDALIDASFPSAYRARSRSHTYLNAVSERVFAASREGRKYVYLGSTSSLPPVWSIYGRVKRQAEHAVLAGDQYVLRAGLVLSEQPGGRFNQLGAITSRLPVLPLPHPSTFRLCITDLDDLLDSVARLVSASPEDAHDLLVPGTRSTSLAELLSSTTQAGRHVIHLGPRASRIFARAARRVHVGPLDSLSSIAGPVPPHGNTEESCS